MHSSQPEYYEISDRNEVFGTVVWAENNWKFFSGFNERYDLKLSVCWIMVMNFCFSLFSLELNNDNAIGRNFNNDQCGNFFLQVFLIPAFFIFINNLILLWETTSSNIWFNNLIFLSQQIKSSLTDTFGDHSARFNGPFEKILMFFKRPSYLKLSIAFSTLLSTKL